MLEIVETYNVKIRSKIFKKNLKILLLYDYNEINKTFDKGEAFKYINIIII